MTGPVLALECALPGVSVGIFLNGKIRDIEIEATASSSAHLLPMLTRRILRRQNVEMGEIGAVAVSSGPGSFTGIRSALAFCIGLKIASKLVVYGGSTLALLAQDLARKGPKSTIEVYLGSTQEWGYYARFLSENNAFELRPIRIAVTNGVFTSDPSAKRYLLGSWANFEQLAPQLNWDFEKLDAKEYMSLAVRCLASFALAQLESGKSGNVDPLYLRPPTVIERLENQRGVSSNAN